MLTTPFPAPARVMPTTWSGDIASAALAVTFIGEVVAGDHAAGYQVAAGARPLAARRAPSCLLEPAIGDRVACWRGAESPCEVENAAVYIVAVLSRATLAQARLSIAGDVELATPSGRLRLSAHDAVEIQAASCTVDVGAITLRTRALALVAATVESVMAACKATYGELQVVGTTCATVFTRESHHSQSHQRSVEGVDRLDAQVIDHEAHELMNLRGKNVLTNGSLVKMQSAQIHLG